MQLIISPAKKMQVDHDTFAPLAYPQFLPQTRQILDRLLAMDLPQLQQLWACSDKLAEASFRQLHQIQLQGGQLTPAILAFVGAQYQSMAPDLLSEPALQYLQANLRIVSGFYGLLRPFDAISPYRLEMGSKLALDNAVNLYAFWGARLHAALDFNHGPVVNLASAEYAKAIRPSLRPDDHFLSIRFGHRVAGQIKTRATKAKIARGAMVRFMAEHQVTTIAGIKAFDDPRYRFTPEASTAEELVFLAAD